MRKSIQVALLLLILGSALFGQSESASIVGTVEANAAMLDAQSAALGRSVPT